MRLTTLVRARALVRPQGRSSSSHADAIVPLRETVESIWRAVAQAAPETALLARRELVRRETCKLSARSEEHTSELQSPCNLVCRLLLEKKKNKHISHRVIDA